MDNLEALLERYAEIVNSPKNQENRKYWENCAEYYKNPETHLRDQLRYALWEGERLDCHRYFEPAVFIGMGSVLEASWFGAPVHYLSKQAPWFDEKAPVFADKSALSRVKPFDFYHSGLCETAHAFYEYFQKTTSGFENLLIDLYDDPDFFQELLGTITEYIKEYSPTS